MKIYTKTGDNGTTALASGQRVSKTDARIATYGAADSLNSLVGWLRAALPASAADADQELTYIQHRLFDLGGRLAAADIAIDALQISNLEQWMDRMQADLEPQHSFLLPAGNECVARCHIVRTATRDLERLMCALPQEQTKEQDRVFINRLSDYFFILARWLAKCTFAPETAWIPAR